MFFLFLFFPRQMFPLRRKILHGKYSTQNSSVREYSLYVDDDQIYASSSYPH